MPRAALLAFTLLFTAPPARAAEFDPKPVDDVVAKAMTEFQVPGAAVVIVQDDRVVYLKGFGVREMGPGAKVTPDTVFAIASCTKAFTATLVAMLADEGKLKWDDKVRDHLDWFRLSDELADREVTLRDLLCHRTGMPRHDWLWSGTTGDSEDVIRRWCRGKSSTSFRSTWEYSNVPFTTAGVVAGRLCGSDWQTAIRKRIFEPLGMTSSGCTGREAVAAADHATPHYLGFDKTVKPIPWDNLDSARGAGSIHSTARDLGNWLRFQLAGGKFGDKQLLAERLLKETHTQQMLVRQEGRWAVFFPPKSTKFLGYGLGWFVHDHRGEKCVSHGGTLTGFRAQCVLAPDKKAGVFVVANLRPSGFTEAVAKAAIDHLLGLPAEDWVGHYKAAQALDDFNVAVAAKKRQTDRKPDTKPSLPAKDYAGTYDERAYGRTTVTADGDKLTMKWGKFTFRLDHYHFDTFTAVPVEPKDELVSFDRATIDVQFRLAANGSVEGLKFLDQEFRRNREAKK
jgi:CubicO group peptidase (beta-lactamase class C family)